MIDKRTVFVLGAGASCPYGYPSGAHLRERICLRTEHPKYGVLSRVLDENNHRFVGKFKRTFEDSSTKSIDLFLARNPRLAPIGKCFIAFEMFAAEERSRFRERAKQQQELNRHLSEERHINTYLLAKEFLGDDWYSYLFDRLTTALVEKDDLPDFSEGKLAFITFNYDRSLEYFLHESLCNSFTEVPEAKVIPCLNNLRILHVYGCVAPLKWEDPDAGVDYRAPISEPLLRSAAKNIKTIYEEKESPELTEAHELLGSAERIFFLGFGYASENMEVLKLPEVIAPLCEVHGTAFTKMDKEIKDIRDAMHAGRKRDPNVYTSPDRTVIENCDCLMLLRKYL
jgi:hypothetical protein